jgi:hypothetical protein
MLALVLLSAIIMPLQHARFSRARIDVISDSPSEQLN